MYAKEKPNHLLNPNVIKQQQIYAYHTHSRIGAAAVDAGGAKPKLFQTVER